MPLDEMQRNRLRWRSRRGMLELDLILMPFAKLDYIELSMEDKERYLKLLHCEDQDMFAWFMGHRQPEDGELKAIVQLVLEKHEQRGSRD